MTDKPWLLRTYAGHSTAKKSNELYLNNLSKGQTGLSIAFDYPHKLAMTVIIYLQVVKLEK